MTKKKIISRFMAALMAAFIFCFSVVPVSASEASDFFDESKLNYFIDPSYYVVERDKLPSSSLLVYDAFYDNYTVASLGYTRSNSFFMAICEYRNDNDYWIRLTAVKIEDANVNGSCIVGSRSLTIEARFSDFVSDVSNYKFDYARGNPCGFSFEYKYGKTVPVLAYFRYDTDSSPAFRYLYPNDIIYTVFYSPFSLTPDINPDNTVLPLGIDVESFFNWYMSTNDRYKNQLYGVEQGSNFKIFDDNLKYLLDYFNYYGADLSCFYSHYPELVPCYKNPDFVGPPSRNDFINLFTILKQHYNIYLKYKSMFIKDIIPNVSEDDTTLITDIDVDTVDISLLREILRTLILTYNSVNDVDYDLSSYVFNMYLKIDSLVDNIDSNFILLRNDLNSNFVNLSNDIGVAVAANLSPSINALAVPLTNIDANVDANLQAVNNIDASLNEVNNSVDNLDVSLHEINNTLNDGSGSDSGGCSGSRPCTPDLPEAEFDDLYDQSGDFFKFWRDLLDSSGWIPASLFTAACLVAIFMRVWGR